MTLEQLKQLIERAKQYKEMPLERVRGFLKNEDGHLDARQLCEAVDACIVCGFSPEDVLLLAVLHLWTLGDDKHPRPAIVDYGNVGAIDRGGVFDGVLAVVRSKKERTEPLTPTECTVTDPPTT